LTSSSPTPSSRSVRTSRARATASAANNLYPDSLRPASGSTPARGSVRAKRESLAMMSSR
jgi:hypothetical protein